MARRLGAALLLLAAVGAGAQEVDLPGRVARVADVAGELFLAPQDRPDAWAPIGVNYPVTTGDNLWMGGDGRAEVDFGGGQFRFAGDANLNVSRLDDREFALFVAQGRVGVRVRVLDPGEVARVDTPNAQVVITRPGLYRIDVSEDRQHTRLAVREGEANVYTPAAVQQVLPGQSADIDGPNPQYANVQNGFYSDEFDAWSADRDRRYVRVASYVSPQMVGAADLAQYGTWSQTDNGAVWYPNDVPPDWAPYRDGYWADVGGFGPTWVDAAPWGYAPFHYGRWAYTGGRWGWFPGTYVARPRWAPAFVAWTGGSGWAVSVGGPVYGWVPLAWGEPYRPWWGRCSYGCWERYNRPYAVNVAVVRPNSPPPQRYRNWAAPGGVTAVSGTAFAARMPVQQNLVRVPRDQAAGVPVMSAPPTMHAAPSRTVTARPVSAPPPASTFERAARAPGAPGSMTRGTPAPAGDPNALMRSRQPSAAAPQPAPSRQSPASVSPSAPSPSTQPSFGSPGARPAMPGAQPQSPSAPQGQQAQPVQQPQAQPSANMTRSRTQQGTVPSPQATPSPSPPPQQQPPTMTRQPTQPQSMPQPQRTQQVQPPQPQPQPQRVQPSQAQPQPQPSLMRSQPQPQPAQPQHATPQPQPAPQPKSDAPSRSRQEGASGQGQGQGQDQGGGDMRRSR